MEEKQLTVLLLMKYKTESSTILFMLTLKIFVNQLPSCQIIANTDTYKFEIEIRVNMEFDLVKRNFFL